MAMDEKEIGNLIGQRQGRGHRGVWADDNKIGSIERVMIDKRSAGCLTPCLVSAVSWDSATIIIRCRGNR